MQNLKGILVGLCIFLASTTQAQLKTSGPLLPPKYVDGVLVVVGNKVILRSELEENKMQMEMDMRGKDLAVQLKYESPVTAPEKPKMFKTFVYHIRRLVIRNGAVSVEQ